MNMRSRPLPAPFYAIVASPADIITLRQQVRVTAREMGLSLAQQAKLTTAASSVVTAVLQQCSGVSWMVRVVHQRGQQVLEVACVVPRTHEGTEADWIKILPLETTAQLVDQAVVMTELGRVMIALRVKVVPATRPSVTPSLLERVV